MVDDERFYWKAKIFFYIMEYQIYLLEEWEKM